jgi:hypothetical protein
MRISFVASLVCLASLASIATTPGAAQEYEPPADVGATDGGTRLGLDGFGVRGGLDFTHNGRLAVGATLDLGQLFTSRLRLRASAELSVFNGPNVYVGSLETLYYFTGPGERTRPYGGLGLGLAGGAECSADPDSPMRANVVGFELRFRPAFNWLVEYHGMDLLRENRIHVGLTTRAGG